MQSRGSTFRTSLKPSVRRRVCACVTRVRRGATLPLQCARCVVRGNTRRCDPSHVSDDAPPPRQCRPSGRCGERALQDERAAEACTQKRLLPESGQWISDTDNPSRIIQVCPVHHANDSNNTLPPSCTDTQCLPVLEGVPRMDAPPEQYLPARASQG